MAFLFLNILITSIATGCLLSSSVWGTRLYGAFLPLLQKSSEIRGVLGQLPLTNLSPFVIWAVSATLSVWVSQLHEMHLSILNTVLVYANDILHLPVRPQCGSLVFSLDQRYCFTGRLNQASVYFAKEPLSTATMRGLLFLLEETEGEHEEVLSWKRCENCLLITGGYSRYIPYSHSWSSVFLT